MHIVSFKCISSYPSFTMKFQKQIFCMENKYYTLCIHFFCLIIRYARRWSNFRKIRARIWYRLFGDARWSCSARRACNSHWWFGCHWRYIMCRNKASWYVLINSLLTELIHWHVEHFLHIFWVLRNWLSDQISTFLPDSIILLWNGTQCYVIFFLMSFGYFFPICDVYCDFVSFFSLYLVHCFNMPNIKDCYSFRSIEGPKMMTDIKVWLLSFIFKSNMYISHLFLLLRKNKFRRLLIKNLNYVSKFIFWLIWILASCIIFG